VTCLGGDESRPYNFKKVAARFMAPLAGGGQLGLFIAPGDLDIFSTHFDFVHNVPLAERQLISIPRSGSRGIHGKLVIL
jgi:hypothetical protein